MLAHFFCCGGAAGLRDPGRMMAEGGIKGASERTTAKTVARRAARPRRLAEIRPELESDRRSRRLRAGARRVQGRGAAPLHRQARGRARCGLRARLQAGLGVARRAWTSARAGTCWRFARPGLDRQLYRPRDYERFRRPPGAGHVRGPGDGQAEDGRRPPRGVREPEAFEEDARVVVIEEAKDERLEVELREVRQARLEIEL